MGTLEGKVAVITGSTRGLGRAIARAYAREGAAVVVSSRNETAVHAMLAELRSAGARAAGMACDVSDLQQVIALARLAVGQFGGFDIWVNNAGIAGPYGPTAAIAPEEFTAVLCTNVFGSYFGSLVALRHFLPLKKGKLINILGRGEEGPAPLQIAYGSSKAWERAFTLALARENRESGVGIYAFNPGLMTTEFLTEVRVIAGYAGRMKVFPTIVRMFGNPPEVPAEKALWLASSATDGRTGMLVRTGSPLRLVGGALREGLRRLGGRRGPQIELHLSEVPARSEDYSAG